EFLSFGNKPGSPEMPGAVLLSFHLADSFFAELRLLNPAATQAAQKNADDPSTTAARLNREFARQLQTRIDALPRRVKHYLFSIFLSPYAKNVLIDFDSMLQEFAAFTRVAADDEQVVARTYLPAGAAQHLALCTYLSLQENYVKEAPLVIVQSRTAQKLQKKTSLI